MANEHSESARRGLPVFSPESDVAIGRNVRALREAAGWSQAELAALLTDLGLSGFYPQTILRIEKGQRALKLHEAVTLAALLDVTAEDLAQVSTTEVRAARLVRQLSSLANELTRDAAALGACLRELRELIDSGDLSIETREAAELMTTLYSINKIVSVVEREMFSQKRILNEAVERGLVDGEHPEAH